MASLKCEVVEKACEVDLVFNVLVVKAQFWKMPCACEGLN